MEIKNVILDRTKISSERIKEKENFESILKKSKINTTTTQSKFKFNVLFYGAIGFSTIIFGILYFSSGQLPITKVTDQKPDFIAVSTIQEDAENLKQDGINKIKKNNEGYQSQKKEERQYKEIENTYLVSKQELAEENEELISENASFELNKERSVFFPSISSKVEGEISIEEIKKNPILTAEGIDQIISFDINYIIGRNDVVKKVNGAQIPKEICSHLAENLNQDVFITNIVGAQKNGDLKKVESMHFYLIK